MAKHLLIDTDVLIDYLRGYPDAVSYMDRKHFPMLQDVLVPYHKMQPSPAPGKGMGPTR